MRKFNYPLYRQRKELRRLSESDSPCIVVWYLIALAAVVAVVIAVSYGAGAMVCGAVWLVDKFFFTKHPSDITREQFGKASEDLKSVFLCLYDRVSEGTDNDGTEESARFYDAYTEALALEKVGDLGSFWESVRRSEQAMREWNSLNA